MKKYLIIILCLFTFKSTAQTKELDSLYGNLERFGEDTNRVNTYNSLAFNLNKTKLGMSLFFAEKAKKLATQIGFSSGLVSAYSNIGIANYYKGEYAIALQNHTKAAKLLEKNKNKRRLSAVYNNIALIYLDLGKYDSAESYFNKSLIIDKKLKNYQGLGDSYNNIGTIYKEKEEYNKALDYYTKALHYRELIADSLGISTTLTNVGSVNILLGNYSLADQQLNSALHLYEKYDDRFGFSLVNLCLGDLRKAEKKYPEAISYYEKSLDVSKKNNIQSYMSYSYEALSSIYEKMGEFKKAYWSLQKHIHIKDKIYNAENSSLLAEIQTKYETEKQKKQIILSKAELTKQNTLKNIFIFGFTLMILLVIFILVSYKSKMKKNKIILEQKVAVEEKNKIIEEKNQLVETQHKDIKDSIKYAERIQGAILPPKNLWNSILPNSFVYHKPKDILSGDFYWIAETEDHKFVAAADCTGHGVPGALISIVNYNLLNKAVLEKNITNPGDILDAVNVWLTESLHQTSENSTVKDGMDISLIAINKKTNEISFSGANNPLYVYKDSEVIEYKGDKFPVGSFVGEDVKRFTTTTIEVDKGDTLYLFSDGYADQFGGEKGKKFKLKNQREQLKIARNLPIIEQRRFLNNRFSEWKGELEQVDDVLIIGIEM